MIIDFHTHIYPGKIAEKAAHNIGEFYGDAPMDCDGTVEALLQRGSSSGKICGGEIRGIDRFVVFSAASKSAQVQSINNFIAGECAAHTEFTGFGTLHSDMENPESEIDRIIKLGLCGIKIHPDMQGFNIDDRSMMDIYSILEGRLPVIFHCGDFRFDNSHPKRLCRVLDAFPNLTVIAAHFGGWLIYDLALEYLRNRTCFLDISSATPHIGLRRTEELIGIYGSSRLFFGSDYPMWDPAECVKTFLRLNLSSGQRDDILYKNALRILD